MSRSDDADPHEEGVSVCVPGAYVKSIDTDGDSEVDVTAVTAAEAMKGSLVIDYEATVTSANGQTCTAATKPVILKPVTRTMAIPATLPLQPLMPLRATYSVTAIPPFATG